MPDLLPLLTHPAVLPIIGVLLLTGLAIRLLTIEARNTDMQSRLDLVMRRKDPAAVVQRADPLAGLSNLIRAVGERVRGSALLSESDMADLEATVAASGYNPARVVSLFIGAKVILLIAMPVVAYIYLSLIGTEPQIRILGAGLGLVVGLMGPNIALGMLRRPYEKALRSGLPDALDLMVVCAEAGLGLETSVDLVSTEMRPSNRPISVEFGVLAQELRLMPDRSMALERMGERTRIEGFKRLGGTLAQTLRFGTPLSQALRTLSSEMRAERLTRFEERGARLPALLVLPLVIFIMPSLFILLIGPSMIKLMTQF